MRQIRRSSDSGISAAVVDDERVRGLRRRLDVDVELKAGDGRKLSVRDGVNRREPMLSAAQPVCHADAGNQAGEFVDCAAGDLRNRLSRSDRHDHHSGEAPASFGFACHARRVSMGLVRCLHAPLSSAFVLARNKSDRRVPTYPLQAWVAVSSAVQILLTLVRARTMHEEAAARGPLRCGANLRSAPAQRSAWSRRSGSEQRRAGGAPLYARNACPSAGRIRLGGKVAVGNDAGMRSKGRVAITACLPAGCRAPCHPFRPARELRLTPHARPCAVPSPAPGRSRPRCMEPKARPQPRPEGWRR